MHRKHSVNGGAVQHVIVAFIKRFSMSHTPKRSRFCGDKKHHRLQPFLVIRRTISRCASPLR